MKFLELLLTEKLDLPHLKLLDPIKDNTIVKDPNLYINEKVHISIEVPHFSDSLSLEFADSLGGPPSEESWGISNLAIYAISCDEPNCKRISDELEDSSFGGDEVVGWKFGIVMKITIE